MKLGIYGIQVKILTRFEISNKKNIKLEEPLSFITFAKN